MNKEEIFAAWSPETPPWSRWAKPVLFAHLDSSLAPSGEAPPDLGALPAPSEMAAVVLDVPGAEGVWLAVALAERGYCPVPLYNAVPQPTPGASLGVAAVDLWPVMQALAQGAERLARLEIPPGAPPAFMLEADRSGRDRALRPDDFDNRSVCLTTDFPSAQFLMAHGIRRAVLVQRGRLEPQPDLAHVLRRWQEGGIALERTPTEFLARLEPFQLARPSRYGAMFLRALAALGLHRAARHDFGAWVPDSSAGG